MSDESPLWVEKYRPRNLSEITNQKEIVERLRMFVKEKNIPHLLFAGPPGTGKTTAILALANDLYRGRTEGNILDLNASVTPDTPILARTNRGGVERTDFGQLATKYFENSGPDRVSVNDLEVLSLDQQYKVRFSKVDYISRHRAEEVLKIRFEGGTIKTSASHSLMVFDEEGTIVSKNASDLRPSDLLISFVTELDGKSGSLSLAQYKPQEWVRLRSGWQRNPKVSVSLESIPIDDEFSWNMGLYLAEGCTSFDRNDSGQTIYVLGYPNRKDAINAKRISSYYFRRGISVSKTLGRSGFDRNRESSVQLRVLNTQFARFFRGNFYGNSSVRKATTKRVPGLIYESFPNSRRKFIEGYWSGDGCGRWGEVARLSSRSKEALIDVSWLARVSALESSVFKNEARVITKNGKFSYVKSELLPACIFTKLATKYRGNLKHLLRHSLYYKKTRRVTKQLAREVLRTIGDREELSGLKRLVESSLYVVKIRRIEHEKYDGYVYDVSVPGAQVFWGGSTPILLHNSDERGINVVRTRIKDFARTIPISDVPFKIIVLDEADAVTSDAQNALRRTMERYSKNARFTLLCNYSSKIIEPIQSRCAVFRFAPLRENDIAQRLKFIASKESVKLEESGLKAILYIASGDLRRAINTLQGASVVGALVSEEIVFKVASRARPEEVLEMLELALSGRFLDARNMLHGLLINYGLSGTDVVKQIHREIFSLKIPDSEKIKLTDCLGEIDFRLTQGANEEIQLSTLLAHFASAGAKMTH
jgi:replication factor C small subunit